MKAVITGAKGTVGSALTRHLLAQGDEVIPWNRDQVPVDQYQAMEQFLRSVRPDVLFHLAIASRSTGRPNEAWKVNYEWTSELAWIARVLNFRFLFTSTVMVFSNEARGPFTADSRPDAREGYGCEKRLAEERVFYQNPNSVVVRLGWQIGERAGSNNMVDFFENQMRQSGGVKTSAKWLPACSFLPDTAAALAQASSYSPGTYMIDSNDKWNFFQIATALNHRHGNRWNILPTEDFEYDQRMLDPRLRVPSLRERLPELS